MRIELLLVLTLSVGAVSCSSGPRKLVGDETPEELFRIGMVHLLRQRTSDAQEAFTRACGAKEKDAEACRQLAVLKSWSSAKSPPDGIPLIPCDDASTCFDNVSVFHGDYQAACAKGDRGACAKQALQLFSAGKRDESEKLFDRLCREADPRGCVGMGLVKADSYKWLSASAFMKKACDAGSLSGCESWGQVEYGHGDKTLAKPAWTGACEKGRLSSCALLARYEAADGGGSEAEKIRKDLCDKGDVYGCFWFASFGHREFLSKGKDLWRKACAADDYLTCGYFAYALDVYETRRPGVVAASVAAGILFGGAVGGGIAGGSEGAKQAVLQYRPRVFELN